MNCRLFECLYIYFSTKVFIEDTGHFCVALHMRGACILRGHLSHAKDWSFAGQGQFLLFSQSYQDPEYGPAPGIKPATSPSSSQAPFRLSSLLEGLNGVVALTVK